MKKRFATTALALALSAVTLMPLTANATEPGIQPGSASWTRTGNTTETFGLTLEYRDSLKPTYTIKVPQKLQMQEDGTDVWIEVSDLKNMESNGKYLSVKVRDTWANSFPKAYRDDDHKYNLYCSYEFMKFTVQPKLSDGTYGEALTDFDQELFAFTESGTKYYRVTPLEDTQTADKPYWWGAINFTVSVENLPAATN